MTLPVTFFSKLACSGMCSRNNSLDAGLLGRKTTNILFTADIFLILTAVALLVLGYGHISKQWDMGRLNGFYDKIASFPSWGKTAIILGTLGVAGTIAVTNTVLFACVLLYKKDETEIGKI